MSHIKKVSDILFLHRVSLLPGHSDFEILSNSNSNARKDSECSFVFRKASYATSLTISSKGDFQNIVGRI